MRQREWRNFVLTAKMTPKRVHGLVLFFHQFDFLRGPINGPGGARWRAGHEIDAGPSQLRKIGGQAPVLLDEDAKLGGHERIGHTVQRLGGFRCHFRRRAFTGRRRGLGLALLAGRSCGGCGRAFVAARCRDCPAQQESQTSLVADGSNEGSAGRRGAEVGWGLRRTCRRLRPAVYQLSEHAH